MGISLKHHSSTEKTPARSADLFNPLIAYAEHFSLHGFADAELFHRKESISVPYLLFDPERGCYLFDTAAWDYEFLEKSTVSPAPKNQSRRDIDVDAPKAFIEQRFDALLHRTPPVVTFLLLEKLTKDQYGRLHESFHILLPQHRVIFADDSFDDITEKLTKALELQSDRLEPDRYLSALFCQYAVLPDRLHDQPKFFNETQRHYIDTHADGRTVVQTPYGGGKSAMILNKALLLRNRYPKKSVMLLCATRIAGDVMKHSILEKVEFAMVDIDPTSIQVMTPEQFAQAGKPVDFLLYDDAHLSSSQMLTQVERIQGKNGLHYAAVGNIDIPYEPIRIGTSYRLNEAYHQFALSPLLTQNDLPENVSLLHGNGYIQSLHLLMKLLKSADEVQIIIAVPDEEYGLKLKNEIEDYISIQPTLLEAAESMLQQDMEHLLIAPIDQLSGLQCAHVIVIVPHEPVEQPWFGHALCRANQHAYIILETSPSQKESHHEES